MKRNYFILVLVAVLTGCVTAKLPEPNLDEKFRSEAQAALAQPLVEMKIAGLKALEPPDRRSAMLRDATVLYLALLGRPGVFAAESKALLGSVAEMRLDRIPVEVQALATLAAKTNSIDPSKFAAGEVRQAVERLCWPRTRDRYLELSADLVTARRQLFDAAMAESCYFAISGRDGEAYLALVDAAKHAYVDVAIAREWSEVGLERTTAAATKFFTARLRRLHGIDLSLLSTP